MGWLRKIGRKIDKGIRKVFGKNGWLKAAATVAALTFAAAIFGTGKMSFASAKAAGSATAKAAGGAMGKELVLEETARAAASTASADGTMFKSLTQATGDFYR